MANWIFDQFLRKISVRTRVIGSFLLIIVLAGSVAPVILFSLNSLVKRLDQVTNVDAKIERLLLLASQRAVVSQLELNRYIQDLTANPFIAQDDVTQALKNLHDAQDLSSDPKQIENIGLVIRSMEFYRQQITDLQKAHIKGDSTEVKLIESQLQQRENDISASLQLMVDENVKQVTDVNDQVLKDAQQSSQVGLTLMVIGFILALLFSILISISITRPLAELRTVAEALQNGGTMSAINVSGADEFTIIGRIFNNLTKQISDQIASLESRVLERTTELNTAVKHINRRAKQFEAITKVSQSISTFTDLQELLPYISQVVSDQFDFYHVGIFLNDENNQYAILAAANSSGGKRMLERGHQLRIGEQGIVGYATSTGSPRIALDVGQDSIYFNNPDLPDTHSEMALPLRIAGKIAGALDIQSTESNAFTDEDVEVLSALAKQVSLAIENARLFSQTEKSLAEADALQRQYLRETWSRLPQAEHFTGFRYSALGATQIDMDEKTSLPDNDSYREIITPITIRGESIGSLSIHIPKHERVTTDQMDLIKAVADRVALSAENARLFEETSRRASRERIISDISSKIGTSVRTESILRTAATELSQLLDNADIFINLQTAKNEKRDTE